MTVEAQRPQIPAEIKRRVLVEAGHRCAIPTCRCIQTELHHIIPWETCQAHQYENLIALCPNCHARADRGEIDRKSLCLYKANLRYTHDKFSQLEVDVLFECYRQPPENAMPWPSYMMLLIKRLIESQYIEVIESRKAVMSGEMKLNPDYLAITETGRIFIESLGLTDFGS